MLCVINSLTLLFISAKGELIIEGKTKSVHKFGDEEVLVVNKDRITAGDGARAHELKGKAAISNSTNGKVLNILNLLNVFLVIISSIS